MHEAATALNKRPAEVRAFFEDIKKKPKNYFEIAKSAYLSISFSDSPIDSNKTVEPARFPYRAKFPKSVWPGKSSIFLSAVGTQSRM